MLDSNGDGVISKEELRQAFGGGQVQQRGEHIWDQIMAEVDRDKDGSIQFVEFEGAMLNILKQKSSEDAAALIKSS